MIRPGRVAFLGLNLLIVGFLVAPLAIVAAFSLNPSNLLGFPTDGLSLRWFERFLSSPTYTGALLLSFEVALAVTLLSVGLGVPAALALARGRLPGTAMLSAAFLSPLTLPAILTGFALFQSLIALGLGRPL